ncbi:peptidyl-tRNA hydrolase [Firmicutes bacterium CAG:460]|jgi:aminoacyl-tRNA hydrolase|uniref:aminoacyl-tRNA hydrolase n=1 Tax=Candidatus Onthocola sp. TaxID=3085646 RepID=UPI00033F135B|nr:aminoacyl-tRNA hydrolase [Bacillota bacterium]CDE50719.1 peptidyl-tRNA hydrolase [Firmicutes bacterium CAG:460]
MKLIVGLGNPDKEYDKTRHNVGFMVIDNYLGSVNWSNKFNALYCEKVINGEKIIFVKPLTYMNNSGNAVGEFVRYFNIDNKDILVIQDDLDLNVGDYKLKMHSSSGGHNGIKSIIASLGNQDFPRLKVGIGSVKKDEVIDYVLGKFSKSELEVLNELFNTFDKIINSFINEGIDKTMNVYNTK